MASYNFFLPYARDLSNLTAQISAAAPGSSGFDTGEVLLVGGRGGLAGLIATKLDWEITGSSDGVASDAARLSVMDRPDLESQIATIAQELRMDIDAYRVVYIDADERYAEVIQRAFWDN